MIDSGPFAGLAGGYGLILADPPWSFLTRSDKGKRKSPERHYDCMSIDDIKQLPVADLAGRDCVLALWSTAPHMDQALDVMKAWGFTYKTMGGWAKRSKRDTAWAFGTGYRYRNRMEPWLLGTRGSPGQLSRSITNLIVAPVREHSRKPDQMRQDLQAAFPGPYVELFSRSGGDPNWAVWGNEVGKFSPPVSQTHHCDKAA